MSITVVETSASHAAASASTQAKIHPSIGASPGNIHSFARMDIASFAIYASTVPSGSRDVMSRMPPRRPLAQTSRGLPLPTGGEETRAITLAGRDLALSLHPLIWDGVADICAREGLTQRELLEALLERSGRGALKRTVETAVAAYYMAAFPNAGTACSPERSVAPAEPTKPS